MNTEQNDSQAELAAWEILAETRQKLAKATEQLTKAHETIGTMIDEIGMLQLKDKATTEQRDRLAEALRKAILWGDSASHHIRHRQNINWTYLNEAKEALQSLTPNAKADS